MSMFECNHRKPPKTLSSNISNAVKDKIADFRRQT